MDHLDPKTRDRIDRLAAMANDSANEHEAMIAARRLHALLAKHGVSMQDLAASQKEYGQDELLVSTSMGGGLWAKHLVSKVAELYFCRVYFTTPAPRGVAIRFMVVGSDQFRASAAAMATGVLNAVDRQARVSSKMDRPSHEHHRAYITSFRNAASARIGDRCDELIAASSRGDLKDEDGNQLPVLASMYDREKKNVDDFLSGMKMTKDCSKTWNSSAAGQAAGDAFGDTVSLGNELSNHAPKAIGRAA